MIDLGWLGQIAFTWEFLVAVMSIVLIDLVLAGDNAVVIAMAVKNLQGRFLLGIFGAADGGDPVPPGLQADCQGLADVGFVVDEQDVQGSRFLTHGLGHRRHPAVGLA